MVSSADQDSSSSVYLVDVLNNQVPPPDPIFPVISLPAHISRGIPHARANPSGKAANVSKKRARVEKHEEGDYNASQDLDDLKEAFVSVECGSKEAEELMDSLKAKVDRISKHLKQSRGAITQAITIALWRDRQGESCPLQACFKSTILYANKTFSCSLGSVSLSKEQNRKGI